MILAFDEKVGQSFVHKPHSQLPPLYSHHRVLEVSLTRLNTSRYRFQALSGGKDMASELKKLCVFRGFGLHDCPVCSESSDGSTPNGHVWTKVGIYHARAESRLVTYSEERCAEVDR
jgi:hypothetical protein